MGENYYYYDGLKTLTSNIEGKQIVYGGVLPMAKMVTGDWVRLIVYPLIFDEEISSSSANNNLLKKSEKNIKK